MDGIIYWWRQRDFPELYIIGLVLILLFIFFFLDMGYASNTIRNGNFYSESYSPDNHATTTGLAITPKGAVPVIATSGHGDEYYAIIKYSDTEYERIRITISQYYSLKQGQEIAVINYYGRWTKINYLTKIK